MKSSTIVIIYMIPYITPFQESKLKLAHMAHSLTKTPSILQKMASCPVGAHSCVSENSKMGVLPYADSMKPWPATSMIKRYTIQTNPAKQTHLNPTTLNTHQEPGTLNLQSLNSPREHLRPPTQHLTIPLSKGSEAQVAGLYAGSPIPFN